MVIDRRPGGLYKNRTPKAADPAPEPESVASPDSTEEPEHVITGTWSSPDSDLVLSDPIEPIAVATPEARPVRKSPFVRVMHSQVGLYPQGSVLPVATFEHIDKLLKLGAIAYEFEETEQHITGDPVALATITGVIQASTQSIPNAPWFTSAAHNLLGATYIPTAQTSRQWTPTPPEQSPVDPTVTITYEDPPSSQV